MPRRLTIVGLGLIGGSLGLALKASGISYEVVGHNRHHEAAGRAKKMGAIDRAEWNLPRALEGAEVVVLAVAPMAVKQVMAEIAPYLSPGAIVTDVASTKVEVLAWADEILPSNVHFVGGHPMAGKEQSGIDAAEATLFRGATYCIIPGTRCAPEAVSRIEELVRAIGGRAYYLDAAEHDSYVAAVSHIPFIASAALVRAATSSPSWRDMTRLASSGFRDGTRTASGDVAMHRDICLTNREPIALWLDRYIDELRAFRDGLATAEELHKYFESAKEARDHWIATRELPPTAELAPPMPSAREGFGDLLFGRRGRKP